MHSGRQHLITTAHHRISIFSRKINARKKVGIPAELGFCFNSQPMLLPKEHKELTYANERH